MLIKAKTGIVTAGGVDLRTGETMDFLPDEEAKRLVAAGYAEAVTEAVTENATRAQAPENATAHTRRK